MKVVRDRNKYKAGEPLSLAIGNFDGVHVGHRKLFETALSDSKARRSLPAVYTFDPHPARIVSPHGAPPLIQTLSQRIDRISECGIQLVIIEKFSVPLSKLSPESYFEKMLKPMNLSSIIVGYDFTFGMNREGDAHKLKEIAGRHQIDVTIIPPQFHEGTLVSSTLIRQLIAACEISSANSLLGYCYTAIGKVVKGQGKGRSLGCPTANLLAENELLPGPGVYLTRTVIKNKKLPSVTSTGPAATFGRRDFIIESHILDYDEHKALAGETIEIEFVKFLRPMISFKSEDELKSQIALDIKTARGLHESAS